MCDYRALITLLSSWYHCLTYFYCYSVKLLLIYSGQDSNIAGKLMHMTLLTSHTNSSASLISLMSAGKGCSYHREIYLLNAILRYKKILIIFFKSSFSVRFILILILAASFYIALKYLFSLPDICMSKDPVEVIVGAWFPIPIVTIIYLKRIFLSFVYLLNIFS